MASWTDNPAKNTTHIRAVHINEIRHTVDGNRKAAGLSPYPWSTPTGVSSRSHIRAVDFTDVRAAITQYMALSNWSVGSAPSPSRQVSARDINDVRTWTDQFSTALGRPTGPDPWSPGSTSYSTGIDVSDNNGTQVQTTGYWNAIANAGYHAFAFIKATEGISYITFPDNPPGTHASQGLGATWSAANQVLGSGNVWLYHFLDWQYSGTDQADHFYTVVASLLNPTINFNTTFFALDVEEPNGTSSTGSPNIAVVNDFIQELAFRMWGDRIKNANFIIYTNKDTWATMLGNPSTYSNLPLWWTAFEGQAYQPTASDTFGGWPDWFIMQYGQQQLQGVPTDVNEL
jgi:GH25 family lysozyme M1 (1,4-beta-N-acetylmuramidase)